MDLFKRKWGGEYKHCRNLGLQSISTKYLAPTNTKGARVKAVACGGESFTDDWDYADDAKINHDRAALNLVQELGWLDGSPLKLHGGSTPTGYVYVLAHWGAV
tara:strand:- start:378 stop:686 length:309 start_codon:yes stop_codon:yes gene_type:complete